MKIIYGKITYMGGKLNKQRVSRSFESILIRREKKAWKKKKELLIGSLA